MTGNRSQSSGSKDMTTDNLTYILITPARNEAKFIEETIKSVITQTIKPVKWVIVSDGSTDGTDDIVTRYAAQHRWIELVRVPERRERHFAGKVDAFNAGYARVKDLEYQVIGNLDGDVSFEEEYIAFLLSKFAENPKLGVTGTPYREENAQHNEQFKSLEHVSGACQMFRRKCFEEIGGYPPIRSGGIDLIALLAAQAKGWQTRRFDEKVCLHHRTVGSGMEAGTFRRLLKRGEKDYLLGSHPVFEIFRSLNQMKVEPYVLGGLLMLVGYYWAMVRGVERTMPEDLMRIRRHDQMRRLKDVLCHPWKHADEKILPAHR